MKNDPGYEFNDFKSQFSTLKKKHPDQYSTLKYDPGSIFNPGQFSLLHRQRRGSFNSSAEVDTPVVKWDTFYKWKIKRLFKKMITIQIRILKYFLVTI